LNKSMTVTLIAINAGLYAVVGTLTYMGIVVFGVKFWPAVIVPASFSALFGPYVGGIGAAVGIFLSDIVSHGMPLLSLSVGVTSNFTCFYIIGHLTKHYNLKRYLLASTLGLVVGSAIIGFGIWAWSHTFLLPGATEVAPLSLFGAMSTFVWTFLSEIPFLTIVVPPTVTAARRAIPMLTRS
jgi:uncharacterized membrane protein